MSVLEGPEVISNNQHEALWTLFDGVDKFSNIVKAGLGSELRMIEFGLAHSVALLLWREQ